MEELLKKLEELYRSDEETELDEDGYSIYFQDGNISEEARELACEHLICSSGCNWNNISILKQKGYSVYAGEKDSFGWLTGCIRKNDDNRILVYG